MKKAIIIALISLPLFLSAQKPVEKKDSVITVSDTTLILSAEDQVAIFNWVSKKLGDKLTHTQWSEVTEVIRQALSEAIIEARKRYINQKSQK